MADSASRQPTADIGQPTQGAMQEDMQVPKEQQFAGQVHQNPHQLRQQWQHLCGSIAELDSMSDELLQLITHNDASCRDEAVNEKQAVQPNVGDIPRDPHASSSNSSESSSKAMHDLQQQLSALVAEKQRIETDRQEMALQQGQYRGTIAQVRPQF